MIIIYILAAIAAIIVWIYFANAFYEVAVAKGYEERKYFWLPLIFGLVGMILVAALPNIRPLQITEKHVEADPHSSDKYASTWTCSACGKVNPNTTTVCQECGKAKE